MSYRYFAYIFFLATTLFFVCEFADAQEKNNERHITIHLRGVFDSKITLTPFHGLNAINPIAGITGVKNGETKTLEIPVLFIPGEFVLRFDYRIKESDRPYSSEKILYVNKQNVGLSINPLYADNSDSSKFEPDEIENTVYNAFIKENNMQRQPIDMLWQFLLSYDRPESDFYTQAINQYEERRKEYNQWLNTETYKYRDLFVASLFKFHYIPVIKWSSDENERRDQILNCYFDGIDFKDTLMLRTRGLNEFLDNYMGLYSMLATSKELADSLFVHAGDIACEKASLGHPKVYGWMVDYFYSGYETYGLQKGIAMLKQHIDNPNCLTSKKQQILKRLEGMARLVPESLSPDFVLSDNIGVRFDFHAYKGKARYKLLLFWSVDCEHCIQLAHDIFHWQNKPGNKDKLDIVAVSVDETETGIKKWNEIIVNFPGWKHLRAQEGVNSAVANDYAVLATPVMFLVRSKSNIIEALPGNMEQLNEVVDGR